MARPTLFDEMIDGRRRATVTKTEGLWRAQVRYCGLAMCASWHDTWADALDAAVAGVAP